MSHPIKFRPRAVLLDFYGTVVHENDVPIRRICARVAEASARRVPAEEVDRYWTEVFGRLCAASIGDAFQTLRTLELASLHDVLARFGADVDAEALSEDLFAYWMAPPVFAESAAVLAGCDVPVCIVSNIDDADLAMAMDASGLAFEHVVTSEACRSYKPRPEMFTAALFQLGMAPHEVIHVGDSLISDIAGARAVGIPTLWINRKGRPEPTDDVKPDHIASDLTGLPSLMSQTE